MCTMKISYAMLNAEPQARMRFYSTGYLLIHSRVRINTAQPGSVHQSLPMFLTNHFSQYVNHRDVTFHTINNGIPSCMVREVVKICFANTHEYAIQFRKSHKNGIDEISDHILNARITNIRRKLSLDFMFIQLWFRLRKICQMKLNKLSRQDHIIPLCETQKISRLHPPELLLQRYSLCFNPTVLF